jgi:hypothetical protein
VLAAPPELRYMPASIVRTAERLIKAPAGQDLDRRVGRGRDPNPERV